MKTATEIFNWLCRKYVQRADERQQKMGLQYMSAETHDLAEEIYRYLMADGDAVMAFKRWVPPLGSGIEWTQQQRVEGDALLRFLGNVQRAGLAHNNGAGGQWIIVGTKEQLLALYRELTAS